MAYQELHSTNDLELGHQTTLPGDASWGVAIVIVIAAVSHFETLKTGAQQMLGLPTPSDVATARGTRDGRGAETG